MLYFAYGSNLHHFQMKRRCKDSTFIKKINLKDFRLTFRSKYRAADIEPKKNSIVPGGLLDKNNDAWVSKNDNPKRKLKYTLEIIKVKKNQLKQECTNNYSYFSPLLFYSLAKMRQQPSKPKRGH